MFQFFYLVVTIYLKIELHTSVFCLGNSEARVGVRFILHAVFGCSKRILVLINY